MRRAVLLVSFAVVCVGLLVGPARASQTASLADVPGQTIRMSVDSSGGQSNDISGRFSRPAVSQSGAFVAFDSIATNLVSGDTNRRADIFVRDRASGLTTRVSVSSTGHQANGDSARPDISGDGRLVVFDSTATNLVPGDDTDGTFDVFVHDRVTHQTTLVSQGLNGEPANSGSFSGVISRNGRYVAFVSDATNLVRRHVSGARDIYVRDLRTGRTSVVSLTQDGVPAGGGSNGPAISANGRYVAFSSFASDIVPGDTNGFFDVFVRDRLLATTTRVSVDSNGAEAAGGDSSAPAISANGQRVAFSSDATNLVADDTNGVRDIFVHDRSTGVTQRVSVGPGGVQGDRESDGPGVRGGLTFGPDISDSGRYVTFDSISSNLVADDTNTCETAGGESFPDPGECPDIFVRDLHLGTTTRVSVSSAGAQGNDASTDPAISGDGTSVVFFTLASNFIGDDTNTCPPFFFGHPGQCPDIYLNGS